MLSKGDYLLSGVQSGKPWELIQKAFQEAGYTLFWRILDAADYGVPQHRERHKTRRQTLTTHSPRIDNNLHR